MKEFLDEYLSLKQELEELKYKQSEIRSELYEEAYINIINSGYYDKYKKCNEIIEYVKSKLEFEESTKNHLLHKNNSIKYLKDIINIYEEGNHIIGGNVEMIEKEGEENV